MKFLFEEGGRLLRHEVRELPVDREGRGRRSPSGIHDGGAHEGCMPTLWECRQPASYFAVITVVITLHHTAIGLWHFAE